MLRRAASTESTEVQRKDLIISQKVQVSVFSPIKQTLNTVFKSPSSKLKFVGFNKARKHLKNLLTRKGDEFSEDEITNEQRWEQT
jgi:hypothetical protein